MYKHHYLGFHPQQIFFRVDSGMTLPKSTTALDVVMFERDENGNVEEMDVALDIAKRNNIDLSKYNWREIVWVTKTREDALRYVTNKEPIDVFVINNALILADDGDNGFLILDVR